MTPLSADAMLRGMKYRMRIPLGVLMAWCLLMIPLTGCEGNAPAPSAPVGPSHTSTATGSATAAQPSSEDAEQYLDERLTVLAPSRVYLSSRDGLSLPGSFEPNHSDSSISILATCLTGTVESITITITQGDTSLGSLVVPCAVGENMAGEYTPSLYSPTGGLVTVEVSEPSVVAFRAVGFSKQSR